MFTRLHLVLGEAESDLLGRLIGRGSSSLVVKMSAATLVINYTDTLICL